MFKKVICASVFVSSVIWGTGCSAKQNMVSESFRKMGEDISWYFSNE